MIKFDNWAIAGTDLTPPRQYDSMTSTFVVSGDIPEGWSWELLVRAGGNLNVIPLSQESGNLTVTLTKEMLALSGTYHIQLKATKGNQVRHTNVLQVFVPPSLSGDTQWPVLPTAFSQALARMEAISHHPPVPGENGFWALWDIDTNVYRDSDFPLPEFSAYQAAVEGGYTGTEAEFNAALVNAATKDYVDTAIFGAMRRSY
ncbi:hypothetical protein [Intestinimonas massiliensis (ex Afouda et al. 2020)]|uniref:hypothetical protein n=1 Tax=Intestinimonas massiliensis (ex Afouda et al. 2020) TaxID=1673721 RepID=UPI00102F68F2|nr:hypothetical protein [Intestinimonas massiliensis (ex Afouda et al. 2020)]